MSPWARPLWPQALPAPAIYGLVGTGRSGLSALPAHQPPPGLPGSLGSTRALLLTASRPPQISPGSPSVSSETSSLWPPCLEPHFYPAVRWGCPPSLSPSETRSPIGSPGFPLVGTWAAAPLQVPGKERALRSGGSRGLPCIFPHFLRQQPLRPSPAPPQVLSRVAPTQIRGVWGVITLRGRAEAGHRHVT